MRLKLITAPTAEPVSLDEVKNHLKVDGADDNALITALIKTSRQTFEKRTGKALITQTWELHLDSVGETIDIPLPPLQLISKIEVVSEAGVKAEVSSSLYDKEISRDIPGRVKLKEGCTWPDHREFDSFIVTFKGGYGDAAAAVPDDIKQAILQLVGHYYEGRQGEEFPKGVEAIMETHKVYWL